MRKKNLLIVIVFGLFVISVHAQVTTYDSPSGQITLSSTEYINNMSKQFNISTGSIGLVKIDATYNTEQNYDYIHIYECDNSFNKLNLVATLHGNNSTSVLLSNQNGRAVVVFTSDGAECGINIGSTAGYTIHWNVVIPNEIAANNLFSPIGQVQIGSVKSSANLKIQEFQNKSTGDINNPVLNYDHSMILLETEYGRKLGLSYDRLGVNGNLGISAEGSISQYAFDYSFATPSKRNAFKISASGNIGLNDPASMSSLINGRIEGLAFENYIQFQNSTREYGMCMANGGGRIGTTFQPLLMGFSKDNTSALYFLAELKGKEPGGHGIMTFDSQQNGKVAPAEMVVFEYCSGWGNRLAHMTGEGSFFVKKNITASGTIRATEIKVEANGQTADFVFDSSYQLRDLQEVEAFIRENKHLPEIPSASEMESNGVNLAEMNKLLLQKIEELTLYAIELEKASDTHSIERDKLEQQVENLAARLENMESLLKLYLGDSK